MDALQNLIAERACIEVGDAFARALDFSDQDHFLELFTKDAELVYAGRHRGLDAIAAFVGSRQRHIRTRHVMTNHWLELRDEQTVRGLAYCTLFAADTRADAEPPAAAPCAVGHCQDSFVSTVDGWRIARRAFHWSFGRVPD